MERGRLNPLFLPPLLLTFGLDFQSLGTLVSTFLCHLHGDKICVFPPKKYTLIDATGIQFTLLPNSV